MLKIEIDRIPEGISSFKLECKPDELDLETDNICFIAPVNIGLRLYRQINTIFVNAEILVRIESECARCLEPVSKLLRASTEVQYSPLPKLMQYQLDDIGIGYYSDEYIDLSNELGESILLEIPMILLCSEDCKGLCIHCGENLNVGKCNCIEPEDDIRVSKFANFVKSFEIRKKLGV